MENQDIVAIFESKLDDNVCNIIEECITKSVDTLINSCVTKNDIVLYIDYKVKDALSRYSNEDINKIILSKDPFSSKESLMNLLQKVHLKH